jgi:predicted transcriptional regulator
MNRVLLAVMGDKPLATSEVAALFGWSTDKARRELNKLVSAGAVNRYINSTPVGREGFYVVNHFADRK